MKEYQVPVKYNWQIDSKPIPQTAFYTLDVDVPAPVVQVATLKGIIEIQNFAAVVPAGDYSGFVQMWINNPELLLTTANRDNIYVQITPYYSPSGDDNVIPYVLPKGFVTPNGLGINIYNANPAGPGANEGEGSFYIYYELYTIS
jgi:hypothetical protein